MRLIGEDIQVTTTRNERGLMAPATFARKGREYRVVQVLRQWVDAGFTPGERMAIGGLQDMQHHRFDDLAVREAAIPVHGTGVINDAGDADVAAHGQHEAEVRRQEQALDFEIGWASDLHSHNGTLAQV